MVKAARASSGCVHVGLLMWLFSFGRVSPGVIEIIEEQSCDDQEFRLTCRGMDTHIAILEAWFTSLEHLPLLNTSEPRNLTRSPQTLPSDLYNQVRVYSSPKHNGFYEVQEHSTPNSNLEVNSSLMNGSTEVNETMNESLDSDVMYSSAMPSLSLCGVPRFQNSYASTRAGEAAGGRRRVMFAPDISINLRNPLSYRCTGVNHCSFVLAEDHAPAAAWGRGALYIKYACFDDGRTVRFCNQDVEVASSGAASEGYVRTPGYPHYYVGEAQCMWRLRAPPGQRLRLTLVDVSLRSIGPFENKCMDYVSVLDASSGVELLSTCDQPELPRPAESQSHAIDVLIETHSVGAYPKRGVLMHYKSVGCATPEAPPGGYLVQRAAGLALYLCDVGAVFPDSRQRARAVECVDDNRWNDTVPYCIEDTASTAGANNSFNQSSTETKMPSNENSVIVDIVIPSLLIAVLFIGNAFIVLIIYKYRKRKTEDPEEEFNTIPLSFNGNAVHTAGNAV